MCERGSIRGTTIQSFAPWLPIQQPAKLNVNLKLYDGHMNAYKLNEMVRFIGIFECVEEQQDAEAAPEQKGDVPMDGAAAPSQNGRRYELHVITAERLTLVDFIGESKLNEVCSFDLRWWQQKCSEELEDSGVKEHRDFIARVAQKLHAIFKLLLSGDDVAASYLLFYLTSHCYHRLPDLPPLGNLPLNLSGVTSETTNVLMNFLSQIVPSMLPIKLNVQALLDLKMVPRKNYETNELEDSLLQLPNGVKTHVVCDETQVTSGKIEGDQGLQNLRAFTELIET